VGQAHRRRPAPLTSRQRVAALAGVLAIGGEYGTGIMMAGTNGDISVSGTCRFPGLPDVMAETGQRAQADAATVYGPPMDVAELAHLRRARDLLDREYARPMNVPVMARAALMSPSLFSRRFRETYGDTPYGYLQARRVERAMALLRRGHMSVTDVCMAVGFTSLGSFSSTFTRLVGEPPSAYKALVTTRGSQRCRPA
jgi:AraC-like DNA-binding protein